MKNYVAFNLFLVVVGIFSNALIFFSLYGAIKGFLMARKECSCFKRSIPFLLIIAAFTVLDCIDLFRYVHEF